MTTIMQPFQCDLQTQTQETHRTTHTEITTRCRTQRRNQFAHETTAAATAAHRRYLSSPPAATLHGKTHGFVLRLPPQHEPHATFMQPSQCILQHDVANSHVSTHMATPDDNNHAAIPVRSANTDSRNAENYARMNNHSLQNTEEELITLGTTPAATAAHRRYPSSPAAATLHGKAQGVVLRLPHTALHQCIVMWCKVPRRPSSMYCYVM